MAADVIPNTNAATPKWGWLLVLVGLPFLAAIGLFVVRGMPDFLTSGDIALLEQATLEATRGEQTYGPYCRYGFNHPGPVFFYAAAPLYAATGHAASAPFVTALLVNLLSALAMVLIARRIFERGQELLYAALLAVLMGHLGGRLATTWNPYASILPFLCGFMSLAAVAQGRIAWLPAAVLATSLAVQLHFGFIPATIALFAVALLLGLWRRDQSRTARKWIFTLLTAAVVFLALWWRPIRAEFVENPGNLERIVSYFRSHPDESATHGIGRALAFVFADYLSTPLSALGVWNDGIPDAPLKIIALGLGALFMWTLAISLRRHDRSGLAFAALTLALAASVAWSVLRITGPIYENLLTWMTGVGFFMFFLIVRAGGPRVSGTIGRTACWILLAAWAVFGSIELTNAARGTINWAAETEAGRATAQIIDGSFKQIEPYGKSPVFVRQLDDAVWKIRAALILRMSKQGLKPMVDSHWFYEYVPTRLARAPGEYHIFLASPRTAACSLPGPGLRIAASNDACVVLFRDVAESLVQPVLAFQNVATSWAVWPLASSMTAGSNCVAELAGPGFSFMTALRPGQSYRVALNLRPLMDGISGIDCALNGVALGGAYFDPKQNGFQRVELDVPGACVRDMNTLWVAGRGVPGSEVRATLALQSVDFAVASADLISSTRTEAGKLRE